MESLFKEAYFPVKTFGKLSLHSTSLSNERAPCIPSLHESAQCGRFRGAYRGDGLVCHCHTLLLLFSSRLFCHSRMADLETHGTTPLPMKNLCRSSPMKMMKKSSRQTKKAQKSETPTESPGKNHLTGGKNKLIFLGFHHWKPS